MNISGILVITPAEHIRSTLDNLNSLPGIDVHHVDEASGRIVITQEAENVKAEVDGIKRIKKLPHITLAEMSAHFFEDDNEMFAGIPAELEDDVLTKLNE